METREFNVNYGNTGSFIRKAMKYGIIDSRIPRSREYARIAINRVTYSMVKWIYKYDLIQFIDEIIDKSKNEWIGDVLKDILERKEIIIGK